LFRPARRRDSAECHWHALKQHPHTNLDNDTTSASSPDVGPVQPTPVPDQTDEAPGMHDLDGLEFVAPGYTTEAAWLRTWQPFKPRRQDWQQISELHKCPVLHNQAIDHATELDWIGAIPPMHISYRNQDIANVRQV